MAKIELLAPKIAKWEGGYINDKTDLGGATNMGVTISTWKQVGYDKDHDGDIDIDDIKALSPEDFKFVLKKYWDSWKADDIKNQSIADILVDWVWGSGKWGVIIPQRILKVAQDGQVGPVTIQKLNGSFQNLLFEEIFKARKKFLDDIVKNAPKQKKFYQGWINRLNDFKFKP